MILSAIAARLKQRAQADFRGRHFEAALIVQAVSWYLRYPLSYRDIEEMLLERGLEVDHSTINRWVLAYAPLVEKRLRQFRRACRKDFCRRKLCSRRGHALVRWSEAGPVKLPDRPR